MLLSQDAKYYIARPEEIHALARALPERYRAIAYLAACCGWRGGEIFSLERDALDLDAREVHVRHQLTVISGPAPHLAPPKTKTILRTNELPPAVIDALRGHRPDAVDQTRTLVDSELGLYRRCTGRDG